MSAVGAIEKIVVTGMPGAYKVTVFLVIEFWFGTSILGEISTSLAIAQIVGFFTAIGWSSLVLVRISPSYSDGDNFNELIRLQSLSIGTLIVASILMLAIFSCMEGAAARDAWIILLGWTIYQLPRHYLIALGKYRSVLVNDVAVLAITTFLMAFAGKTQVGMALAVPMVACGVIVLILERSGSVSLPRFSLYDFKGVEFGAVNFLSGALPLIIIPIVNYMIDAASAGIVSVLLSIISISVLFPRAIALSQISRLSALIKRNDGSHSHISLKVRRSIGLSNLVAMFINMVFAGVIYKYYYPGDLKIDIAVAFGVLVLYFYASNESLHPSCVLTALEKSRQLVIANALAAFAFVVPLAMAYWLGKPIDLLLLGSALLASSVIRLFVVSRAATTEMAKRTFVEP